MIQPDLILYHAKWSLCSQMVRVALHEKGFKYQHKVIKLCDHYDDADNLSKEFLSVVNPTGVVPVLNINGEFVRDSAYIIERLDEFEGPNQINLWPKESDKRQELRKWVYETTIDENVKLGKSFGTTIPLFSTGLIEVLVKKLKLKSIFNIIIRHPRKERKIAFVAMYFLSLKNRIGPIAYEAFVNGLIEIDKHLDKNEFLFEKFSHADINLMCCFHRLEELRLSSILEMKEFKNISTYWKKLKNRNSYKDGILNFSDHEKILMEAFPDNINPHLIKLKNLIKEKTQI